MTLPSPPCRCDSKQSKKSAQAQAHRKLTFIDVQSYGSYSNSNHAFGVVEKLDGFCVQGKVIGVLKQSQTTHESQPAEAEPVPALRFPSEIPTESGRSAQAASQRLTRGCEQRSAAMGGTEGRLGSAFTPVWARVRVQRLFLNLHPSSPSPTKCGW